MADQFLRKASLVIGEGTQALDLSSLHFTFNVVDTSLDAPKTAYVRIFNLSKNTARTVTTEGTQIILSAGYEGGFNTIFNGQITQARIGRENGTDTYLDITAADSDKIYNYGMLNFSVAAGTDVIGRLGQIATAAGVKLGTVQAPPNGAKLSRGAVFFGLARDHLREQCATIGANWSINEGQLDVVAEGGYKPGDIPVITSATGMIGVPEQTEIGISVRCLLNPNLQKNMRVQLDNASIRQYGYSTAYKSDDQLQNVPSLSADGIYKVLYVNHHGDTRGQDWYSDFVAYSRLVAGAGGNQQLTYMPQYKPILY
ncbi:MAG: hypothetical protein KGJ54_06390 [Betaproteobacteria bacterium]|nr:hypothetical protein [Betaproteobacteria bacterium]